MKFNIKEWQDKHLNTINEKHGKIPNLDLYIRLTDPNAELSNSEFAKIEKIEKEAESLGMLNDLITASSKTHWGRYDNINGMDELEYRKRWIKSTQNRITKGGKLNKNSASWLKNQMR